MIDLISITTTVPPRSDVFDEGASDLAFQFGEQATSQLVSEMSAVHAGQG